MSFRYDITGDIIYIWALILTPTKLGILNNQCERNGTPTNPAYTIPPIEKSCPHDYKSENRQ